MSTHLSPDELTLIIQKTPHHLVTNRFLHYEKCSYCQTIYEQQLSVHKTLLNISPLKAPVSIIHNVARNIETFSSKATNGKTDWVFFVALIILFGIGAWFLFSGSLGDSLVQYLPQSISKGESINKAPAIVNSIKDSMKGINISFDLFKTNGHGLYVFFGFLSFLFYMILDKKFGHGYRIK